MHSQFILGAARIAFLAAAIAFLPQAQAFAQGGKPKQAEAQPKPDQPSPAAVKQATEAFKQGATLFGAKRYGLALQQFRKSYDTVASPNSALYIARCHVEMGQRIEAFNQFKKVIAEAEARAEAEPKYLPTRDSAKGELEELLNSIGALTINVSGGVGGSTLRVGGVIVPKADWGTLLPFEPGSVEVRLETPGKEPTVQEVEVKKGARETINIAPPVEAVVEQPPPPPPVEADGGPSALLPVAVVFGSVGVIGMGVFGVAGGMSISTFSDLEKACPTGKCPKNQDPTIDRGEREQLIANIGAVVGAVGLAAGATFMIIELASPGGSSKEAASVDVNLGPGYVGVSAKF